MTQILAEETMSPTSGVPSGFIRKSVELLVSPKFRDHSIANSISKEKPPHKGVAIQFLPTPAGQRARDRRVLEFRTP